MSRFSPVELTTGRLLLRPWRADEAERVRALLDDPEVGRWTPHPHPYPLEAAQRRLAEDAGRWQDGSRAELAVLDAASGELVGSVGLYRAEGDVAEVGWVTAAAARGRGIAAEAVGELCRWAGETQGLVRLVAHVAAGNEASLRVARRCGFVEQGVEDLDGDAVHVLVRDGQVISSSFSRTA